MSTTSRNSGLPAPEMPARSDHPILNDASATAAVSIMLVDRHGTIFASSDKVCRMLGHPPGALTGANYFDLLHPDDREAARLRSVLLQSGMETTALVERRLRAKDGTYGWYLNAVGRVNGERKTRGSDIICQLMPIDRQKKAEAEAEDAANKWTFALTAAGQGAWELNLETPEWVFSPTWRRMRGIPDDEVIDGISDNWLETVHPDDREYVAETTRHQYEGSVLEVSFEYRERHRDGHYIWILARGRTTEFFPDGRPKRLIGTDTDITAIKERDQAREELTERMALAVSATQFGVWEADLTTNIPLWDARTCEIFGAAPDDFPDPTLAWSSLVHPDDLDGALAYLDDLLSGGSLTAHKYRIVRKDGSIRHLRTDAQFVQRHGGRPKLIGMVLDITDDVKREFELQSANRLAEQRNIELENARAAMEHASLHDALTGLPNRRYLDQLFQHFDDPGTPDHALSVLHLDLDRFKQINDTLGHEAGDWLLKRVAGILSEKIGGRHTIVRMGGDEFVVILRGITDRDVLDPLLESIIADLNRPMEWNGATCHTSTSIGIATSQTVRNSANMVIDADLALYHAKNLGRNRAAYFDSAMQRQIIEQKALTDDLIRGLRSREFIAYYQPQFDARTLDIVGVEALARWRHPLHGVLTPHHFLSVAGDINAVAEIDEIVLEHAIADLRRWDDAGLVIPKLSVNVSANRLNNPRMMEGLRDAAWLGGRLSFELLESIFLDDSGDEIQNNINALRKLDVQIEIDDFGTGHASIVSLLKLSPDRLKIERQLIAPIVESEKQRRLVRSIVDIGRSLDIQVCAEGVETREHVEILRELGCNSLQGFYFAKPLPAAELAAFARSNAWRGAFD